jgi:ubiquinol-cytochrome c reductase cytochrome b subunit
LLGRWKVGHVFNLGALWAGLGIYAAFTVMAYWHDLRDPAYAPQYLAAVKQAHEEAERVKVLAARNGIPTEGALSLLRDDPLTQAPKLFAAKCANCHSYEGKNGLGLPLKEKQTAAELKGWGSREWLRAYLDPKQITAPHMWGGTAFAEKRTDMVEYILDEIPKFTPEHKAMLDRVIVALSAEAALPSQREADAKDAAIIEQGRKDMGADGLNCIDCHEFHGEGGGKGPSLTGWASREWTIGITQNPTEKKFYGRRNDRMPAFGVKGELSVKEMTMLADWMRGDVK